jgi:hypothetical protein
MEATHDISIRQTVKAVIRFDLIRRFGLRFVDRRLHVQVKHSAGLARRARRKLSRAKGKTKIETTTRLRSIQGSTVPSQGRLFLD